MTLPPLLISAVQEHSSAADHWSAALRHRRITKRGGGVIAWFLNDLVIIE